MKISQCSTHPQGILGVYYFFLLDESNRELLIKIVLALSSFIMAWTGVFVQQSKSSEINAYHTASGVNKGLLSPVASRCIFGRKISTFKTI